MATKFVACSTESCQKDRRPKGTVRRDQPRPDDSVGFAQRWYKCQIDRQFNSSYTDQGLSNSSNKWTNCPDYNLLKVVWLDTVDRPSLGNETLGL